MIDGATVDAAAQSAAITSEAARRKIILPQHFDVPDRSVWEDGYALEAQRSLLPHAKILDEALAVVKPFIDPLLDGTASGVWDPKQRRWT
jgi:hypothetical protein